MRSTANYDRAAAFLSLSCVVHCVALPVAAVALPFLGAVAEAEWIHWLLTGFAILASAIVMARSSAARSRSFLLPAIPGLLLIAGALVAEPLGIDETPPTVVGGLLLAFAHIRRLYRGG
ncbi:MAG: MerC domain-containing protein [Pseudomonadota bacterium]